MPPFEANGSGSAGFSLFSGRCGERVAKQVEKGEDYFFRDFYFIFSGICGGWSFSSTTFL
jgi:hypothetical protein